MDNRVYFDREKLRRLKAAYKEALNEGKDRHDSFVFEDREYLVAYANYLIQYLEEYLPQ